MSGDDLNKPVERNGRSPFMVIGGLILIGLAIFLLLFGTDLLGNTETSPSILEQIPAFQSTPPDTRPSGPLQAGDPVHDFVLNDLDGKPLRLADLRGRPIILNFWATWCAPCRIEMPDLQAVYDRHQTDGLMILALNRGETAAAVRAFFYEDMGLTFTPLLDEAGAVAQLYNVLNYPTSYFVAPDGTVTAVHLGAMSEAQIESYLADTIPGEE